MQLPAQHITKIWQPTSSLKELHTRYSDKTKITQCYDILCRRTGLVCVLLIFQLPPFIKYLLVSCTSLRPYLTATCQPSRPASCFSFAIQSAAYHDLVTRYRGCCLSTELSDWLKKLELQPVLGFQRGNSIMITGRLANTYAINESLPHNLRDFIFVKLTRIKSFNLNI